MHFLASIPHVTRETAVAFGLGAAASFLVLFAFVVFGRRRNVTIGMSPTMDMLSVQLGRIADAVDRLSKQRESTASNVDPLAVRYEIRPVEGETPERHVSMSMLGR